VAETASAMTSRVVGSSRGVRPTDSGCISDFRVVQTSSSCVGLMAMTRQKAGTKSMFLVFLMSAKMAATLPVASLSSTGRTVAMRCWDSLMMVLLDFPAYRAGEIDPKREAERLRAVLPPVALVFRKPDETRYPRIEYREGRVRETRA
jgi:hypothetical protein